MNRPQRARVYLSKLDRDLVLNFITLADDKFIFDQWGGKADELFRRVDIDMVLGLFWRLLDGESKAVVASTVIEDWTLESVEPKQIEVKSPVEKLKYIVAGQRELFVIWSAILETRRKSDPELTENDLKKKTEESP
jgi:hypothetical protein